MWRQLVGTSDVERVDPRIQRAPRVTALPERRQPATETAAADERSTGDAQAGLVRRLGPISLPEISADDYRLSEVQSGALRSLVHHRLESPDVMSAQEWVDLRQDLRRIEVARRHPDLRFTEIRYPELGPAPRLTLASVPDIRLPEIQLQAVRPLSKEEYRFMSGLLLARVERQCSTASPLFASIARHPEWRAEASFHLAKCAQQMGLISEYYERVRDVFETKDRHFSTLLMDELGADLPYEYTAAIGEALAEVARETKEQLKPETLSRVSYLITEYAVAAERYKTALVWAPLVNESHSRYHESRYLLALAQFSDGNRRQAIATLESLLQSLSEKRIRLELQAVIALNLGRMHFQERDFAKARERLQMVTKDNPLWLQSLTEMGWAQLSSDDIEGAVGNMYSVHSPFFASIYKPESYVIRTIGYLQLCQYGDAYKSLTMMEREYRDVHEKIDRYLKASSSRGAMYETLRRFLSQPGNQALEGKRGLAQWKAEVDGLPVPVIREVARHRDFINLQRALNRQVDERPAYDIIPRDVESVVRATQAAISESRKRVTELRRAIGKEEAAGGHRDLGDSRGQTRALLLAEFKKLNGLFFRLDLIEEAKASLVTYHKEVIQGSDARRAKIRGELERILAQRLTRLRSELDRMLDNNELLRYEVFAGSGENIRFQVAGGEQANRVPASVMPRGKSLQWNFDGEFWEDEIGHYRSSLKSQCPDPKVRQQAQVDGGSR
jgi:tetratricopeptide (TPR) repeat protein